MFEVCKHSLFRLKITVGRRLCAYPSIHFSLDEDTLKITVGCLVCGVVCVVCCGGGVCCCVVVVRVCGEAWHTLSLSLVLSPSSSLSLSFSLLSFFFSLLFLFLFLLLLLLLLLLLSATTAATSSSAIVGKCEQGGKQSINQKCF